MFWVSRVEIEVEAGNVVKAGQAQSPQTGVTTLSQLVAPKPQETTGLAKYIDALANPPSINVGGDWKDLLLAQWTDQPEKKVVTHKGRDVFEVLWSAEVIMVKDLKKGIVGDIKHVGLSYQAVT